MHVSLDEVSRMCSCVLSAVVLLVTRCVLLGAGIKELHSLESLFEEVSLILPTSYLYILLLEALIFLLSLAL